MNDVVYGATAAGVMAAAAAAEAGAQRLFGELLDRSGVEVRLGEDELPDAAVYADASYEGDLLQAFGVPYAVGREPQELYGETWAGRQAARRDVAVQDVDVDALPRALREDGQVVAP